MIPRDFGKKLSEIQNVGVTITPGSPRGWTTHAVECYYNAIIIIIIITPCHTGLTHHIKFLTFRHSGAQDWAPECLNVKNYKVRPVGLWIWTLWTAAIWNICIGVEGVNSYATGRIHYAACPQWRQHNIYMSMFWALYFSHRLSTTNQTYTHVHTLCLKNNTDAAHYNFDANRPIIIIFGRDVAERVCYQTVISPLYVIYSVHGSFKIFAPSSLP